ncbi:MAG TPA: hypothetical protein VNM91_11260, partial [Dehalococcoidia bacterium]|nr:hypothetical protein [Dehalococcoidia bacterium]
MATDVHPGTDLCVVCGERADAKMSADCNWCDGRYHLNQRNDVVAKDCGQVWIDEQYMALQFACNNCLASGGAPQPPARQSAASRVEAGR